MAKSLGMIHTVDTTFNNAAAGDLFLMDLPGQLSKQLQHRIRLLSNFKVCGIDIGIVGSGAATVSGEIRYFAPTKGRVEALKEAWTACKTMFKLSGVKYWNNINYDFRPIFRDPTLYQNGGDFLNQASLESVGGVPGALCLVQPAAGYQAVFATYNAGIQPAQTAAIDFTSGFHTIEAGTAGDMVINEGEYINSWVAQAQELPEKIPFQLSMDTANNEASTTFMWRPDPALYLSVLTGQLEVDIQLSSEPLVDLNMSVMVSGWKSLHDRRKSTKKMSGNRGRSQRKSTKSKR